MPSFPKTTSSPSLLDLALYAALLVAAALLVIYFVGSEQLKASVFGATKPAQGNLNANLQNQPPPPPPPPVVQPQAINQQQQLPPPYTGCVPNMGKVVYKNMEGCEVAHVQVYFNANGITDTNGSVLDIDGDWGSKTESAFMKKFATPSISKRATLATIVQ